MLTVVQIRALKPAERPYKVADVDGLYLLVQRSGALLWRFRYRCCGIERKLSLGSFPDVTLVQARRKRDEAKAELDDGIDPVEEKRQRRLKAELAAQTTFALVADRHDRTRGAWQCNPLCRGLHLRVENRAGRRDRGGRARAGRLSLPSIDTRSQVATVAADGGGPRSHRRRVRGAGWHPDAQSNTVWWNISDAAPSGPDSSGSRLATSITIGGARRSRRTGQWFSGRSMRSKIRCARARGSNQRRAPSVSRR